MAKSAQRWPLIGSSIWPMRSPKCSESIIELCIASWLERVVPRSRPPGASRARCRKSTRGSTTRSPIRAVGPGAQRLGAAGEHQHEAGEEGRINVAHGQAEQDGHAEERLAMPEPN